MATFTAIYDACVLYPAPLRDFLMWLALTDLFKARWTLKNPPKTPDEYLDTLAQQGLTLSAAELRELCDEI